MNKEIISSSVFSTNKSLLIKQLIKKNIQSSDIYIKCMVNVDLCGIEICGVKCTIDDCGNRCETYCNWVCFADCIGDTLCGDDGGTVIV